MPEIYADDNGQRVIIRHKGPAGAGLPAGGVAGQIPVKLGPGDFDVGWTNPPSGTGAVAGPTSSLNGTFVLFDGTTGKILKDSAVVPAYFATKSYADSKQDAEPGKGLSQQNFTTVLKAKLDSLSPAGFRGSFASLAQINANTFNPVPQAGDYCLIGISGTSVQLVLWDATNSSWTVLSTAAEELDGSDLAALIFDSEDTWSLDSCRIFTDEYKGLVDSHEALIQSAGLNPAAYVGVYGGFNYFSLTGTAITVTGTSDGVTNITKVLVGAALTDTLLTIDGDSPAVNARLRYTGTVSQKVVLSANISLAGDGANASTYVVGIARNGAILQQSRTLITAPATGDKVAAVLNTIVTLAANDYLEVFIGRTSGAVNPTVFALTLSAERVS